MFDYNSIECQRKRDIEGKCYIYNNNNDDNNDVDNNNSYYHLHMCFDAATFRTKVPLCDIQH